MRSIVLTLFFLLLAVRIFFTNKESESLPLITTNTFHFDPSTLTTNPPLTKKGNDLIDTAALKKSDWYAQVIRSIEEKEYTIQPTKDGRSWAGSNRQQHLHAFYTANRLTLQPRKEDADKWKLQLSLLGIYAGKQKIYAPAANATVEEKGNSILFHHHDEFTVEYINNAEGVRENFIVQKKPADNIDHLSVALTANSGWLINKVHEKEIHFAKTNGGKVDKKITYNGLKAWDADNNELETSFSVNNNSISIHVNTTNAIYPVTIDPLSTTASWMGEENQANANYGTTAWTAGDVNGDGYSDVVVAAYQYGHNFSLEGAAFAYHGSATGLSTTAAWIIYGEETGAQLRTVATAGDVNGDGYSDVVVGSDLANSTSGKVSVYFGSVTGLSPTADWTELRAAGELFGRPVACAGDVNADGYSDIIIGSANANLGLTGEGLAYVYYGSNTGPGIYTPLRGNQVNAQFGYRVNSAGDVNGDGYSDVIVGAWMYDNGETNEGRAFVYYGSSGGIITTPAWTSEINQANANYGSSVGSGGDFNGDGYSDVAVGASLWDNGQSNEGGVWIYYGSAGGLSATANWTAEGNTVSGNFAWVNSVGDVNGDGYSDILVTASGQNRAYVFHGSATGLSVTANWAITGTGAYGNQGSPAGDINGDGYADIIVTAYFFTNGQTNEGAAYVYNGSPDGLATTSVWSKESNQANAQLGASLAAAGDINGDGYSDVIIGAPQYTNGQSMEGACFAYCGSASGLPITPNWIGEGNQANAYYGTSVASAGDVNGDGYSDIIIGAYNKPAVSIHYGSAAGLSATANWTVTGPGTTSFFGYSVASAGDVNSDGYGDVIIGARNFNSGDGAVYAYYGSATGPALTASWSVSSTYSTSQFGHSVSGAGDVNGDGFGDVIVGAIGYDNVQANEGAAFVYYGSSTGLSATANWSQESNRADAFFGYSVAAAGDVNGDGYSDVIVGARDYNNGQAGEGAAFVYYGAATGLSATASWMNESNQTGISFSSSVSCAGDVNGDGYSDLIISSPNYNAFSIGGRVSLFYGSAAGLPATASVVIDGSAAFSYFGNAVSGAGDVNGDGYSDVIVGSYQFSNGQTQEGKVFLYYGNGGTSKRNNLRLYNQDLTTPIQQSSIAPALFGAGLFVKSPIGRQKGKLTWETVKNGQPFSGNPITNSTAFIGQQTNYTDLGTTGAELKNVVAKALNGKATYVRARVKYNPATATSGQLYGPWRYPESFLRGSRSVGAIALPVKFISFIAVKQNDKALLKWITTDEAPGVHYEVQHSTDGIHFNTIKTIIALNGASNTYEWLHTNPTAGKDYYRIRAVENSKDAYSITRQLYFGTNAQVLLYPNPVKSASSLTLQLTTTIVDQTISVELFNNNGQKMAAYNLMPVNNSITINLPVLSPGHYIVKVMIRRSLLCSSEFMVMK